MMRNLMTAMVFAVVASFVTLPAAVSATAAKPEQVLQKKKKLKAVAVVQTDRMVVAKAKKAAKKVQLQDQSAAASPRCKGIMQCLFGVKRGVRVTRQPGFQQASFSASSGAAYVKKSRKTVAWTESKYPVGSLIVKTPERALYYVLGDGEAIRYAVGVGREGMQWSGKSSIVSKAEWPSWTPPQEMITREAAKGHILPPFMEGGPGNPLGARALYIGGKIYRVHGTNNESSIGGAVSSGCIRMMNADVIDLYERVKIGARIYVYQ